MALAGALTLDGKYVLTRVLGVSYTKSYFGECARNEIFPGSEG